MPKKHIGQFGSAIFCNNATPGQGGKTDCRGIFTSFLVWGYPTSFKVWNAIVTLYNLPQGTTSISVSISKRNGKKKTLAVGDTTSSKRRLGEILIIPLACQFKEEGFYNVHFNIVGTTKSLKVPLKVTTQKWPEFTKKEKGFIHDNPNLIGPIRINITCSDCSQPYIFEEAVLPDYQLAHGVHAFPQTGTFECESCGRIIHLKDFQGRIRSSIKTAVSAAMRGGI